MEFISPFLFDFFKNLENLGKPSKDPENTAPSNPKKAYVAVSKPFQPPVSAPGLGHGTVPAGWWSHVHLCTQGDRGDR